MKWWDESWNPILGCSPASVGCANCYAERLHTQRNKAFLAGEKVPGCYAEPFDQVRLFPERIAEPLGWRKPRRVFVGSMTDLFHPQVEDWWLDRVFAVMALTSWHTFMLLTKRAERMRDYVTALISGARDLTTARRDMGLGLFDGLGAVATVREGLPNVWLGTTAENQAMADLRIPVLLDTPAARRFVSVEPMLGPVDLHDYLRPGGPKCPHVDGEDGCCTHPDAPTPECFPGSGCPEHNGKHLDWVICGGESGPGARPMNPVWARILRDQCAASFVPFLFKQWGEWTPTVGGRVHDDCQISPGFKADRHDWEGDVRSYRVGSRAAGRVLDGRTYDAMPEVRHGR